MRSTICGCALQSDSALRNSTQPARLALGARMALSRGGATQV